MSVALRPDDLVLVTGGSGFLGSAVVRALIARGSRVRAFVRSSSPPDNLMGLGCEIVAGDLTDQESLKAAMQGVRYLFHVAADEAIGAYKRSKTLAERAVEAMTLRDKLPAIIVNPTTPIGPRDIRPTPTGRILLDAARGRIPAFVDTGLNFAHVDDIAEGHLLAFERGRIGERYILGGENVLLHELLAAIAGVTGRRAPRLKLPRTPLFPLAFGAEAIARLTGKEPLLTVDGLRLARYRMFFTSAKAERELGYRSRPYQEGVVDALAWFRKAGYLT